MNNLSDSSSVALTFALNYARRGFSVFPIYEPTGNGCSCRHGQHCPSVGKHPRTTTGYKAATRDEEQIAKWWTMYPNANIGIATGTPSSLVVLDIDDRNDGPNTLDALLDEAGQPLPITLTAQTGNGFHYYFLTPEQPLRSQNNALGNGIDVKAEGGYVVAPPSQHRSGINYQFLDPDAPIAALPSWIADRLDIPMRRNDSEVSEESGITEGYRNATLTSMAGELRQKGAELAQIRTTLLEENKKRCNPQLPEYEVDAIAKSVCRYPPGSPTQNRKAPLCTSTNPLWWLRMDTRWWHENQNIRLMDAEQRGWYITLLITAWPAAGRLPADVATLAKLADAKSARSFERNSGLLLAEFELRNIDGIEYRIHPMLEKEYASKLAAWEQKRVAGKASGAKRKLGEGVEA